GPAAQFVGYLLGSNHGYALLWQKFLQMALLLDKERHPGVDEGELVFEALPTIMGIAVWCLLGNYQLEGTKACPTVRFENLLAYLVDDYKNPHNRENGIAQIWDHWDLRIGTTPWRQALEALLDFNQRGLDAYSGLGGSWEGSRDIPNLVITLMRTY